MHILRWWWAFAAVAAADATSCDESRRKLDGARQLLIANELEVAQCESGNATGNLPFTISRLTRLSFAKRCARALAHIGDEARLCSFG